ncbi:MAG: 16S rRNA (uracil1498-N3)-methyltransferase [Planctomycetota bacterium]|jgi:16S rRNA (uracil1498-N3)-methyltransferase
MRISRVFCGEKLALKVDIKLDKPAFHYLKHVLRLETGATLVLFNGEDGIDYQGTINMGAKSASVFIDSQTANGLESPLHSEIIQGLARSDHLDWMIQKSTELGVRNISLFNAVRTQIPLKPKQLEKKLNHWKSVASSACEQCGRSVVPSINFYKSLQQALLSSTPTQRIVLDFSGLPMRDCLPDKPPQNLAILLGPEGGLDATEIEQASQAGFLAASLGPRVLRTETAAVAALTLAQAYWGDI